MILLVLLPAGSAVFAATILWWDTNYLSRFNVDVATGANAPDKGYNGYTKVSSPRRPPSLAANR